LKNISSHEIGSILKTFELLRKEHMDAKNNPVDHISIKEFSVIPSAIEILHQISLYYDAIDISKTLDFSIFLYYSPITQA